jgi:MFS family permease
MSWDDAAKAAGAPRRAWYRELNRYHWFVLAVACMGWMFDTMAQQLFNLARKPALRDLLGGHATAAAVDEQGAIATAVFMLGWAMGGVLFGVLGDRVGRARTMTMTILCYTLFTGLSVLSTGVWDFDVYRFLCGLGVGGQFSVGVALVAEVVPEATRPYALGMVQAFSTVGNMIAALTVIALGKLEQAGAIHGAWRYTFLAGAVPAPLALVVFRKLKEPEEWLKARAARTRMGSYGELLGNPRWRRNAIAGLLLAFAGVVGLWGIGFFSYDLLRPALEKTFRAQGLAGADLAGRVTMWIGVTSLLQNLGGFFGVHAFTYLTQYTGRKKAFAASFLAAMFMTAYTFWNLKDIVDIFWMVPLMGFTQLALFGGYAIYLPELFPTRLRSTGTSFCYNVGRFAAAAGPFTLGLLTGKVFAAYAEPMRYAGVAMCLVFLVGLAALPLAPETRGKPLPE